MMLLGQSIPPDTAHAVSVSLPTWQACVGYEEGEEWVLSKMKHGYPRFFVHGTISAFAEAIVKEHGSPMQHAMLFPSHAVADRCVEFIHDQVPVQVKGENLRIIDLDPHPSLSGSIESKRATKLIPSVSAVLLSRNYRKHANAFWQHSGDGISSRRAEICHKAFDDGLLVVRRSNEVALKKLQRPCKGPRRYQRGNSMDAVPKAPSDQGHQHPVSTDAAIPERKDYVQYVEERFGRNLDESLAMNAKLAIRRRIAGSLTVDVDLLEKAGEAGRARQVRGFSEDDVYLYPTGMSSIFNTHRIILAARGARKSICFGFPYIDTLKILEKWGPGCLFYGHGSPADLDDLEQRCKSGEKYLALFCEFPGNPLLKSPDLRRLRSLANRYDFAIVIDETIGTFVNVNILPYADVAVSSLTKVFSGDSNVMGGSSVLNPNGKYYELLRIAQTAQYEDNYWSEDAIFMERNSRDFVSRVERININAEAICRSLKASPSIKEVYYPKYSSTRHFYDRCRNLKGGYGGLLSVTFNTTAEAVTFFDTIETAKGPSLGTNFTLCSPYTLLAHYGELQWAAQFGVEADLVRFSVGLEDAANLTTMFERALAVLEKTPYRS